MPKLSDYIISLNPATDDAKITKEALVAESKAAVSGLSEESSSGRNFGSPPQVKSAAERSKRMLLRETEHLKRFQNAQVRCVVAGHVRSV